MTERMTRPTPYGGYIGETKPAPGSAPAVSGGHELSPKKTLFVLVVVVGCFAILWPKLFYPMLVANANNQMKPNSFDKGCCDVINLKDVETIRIMSELCKDISTQQGSPPDTLDPKKMVDNCRKSVLETCGIDISAALRERAELGHSVKQILDEVRSLNGSLCLKYNFGLSLSRLGVPHIRVTVNPTNKIRQERPPHLRPEIMHPAFRERGKAIPHPELSVTKRPSSQPPPRIVEGRPGPIPGLRPGLGGAGHVVQKHQGNGIMGFLMPIYTIGFVIFFTYTLMKIAFKKKPEMLGDEYVYPEVYPDETFRQEVFESSRNCSQQKLNGKNQKDSKIADQLCACTCGDTNGETPTIQDAIINDLESANYCKTDEIKVEHNGINNSKGGLENNDFERFIQKGNLKSEKKTDNTTNTSKNSKSDLENNNFERYIEKDNLKSERKIDNTNELDGLNNGLNEEYANSELNQLRRRLRETELAMERIVRKMAEAPLVVVRQDEVRPNGSAIKEENEEEDQPRVAVMGMETRVSSEDGKKWSRPDSPVLPHPRSIDKESGPPPQEIYLEATLPPDSQILVADSATETEINDEDDSAVVLAGKMTLSVISLDSENDNNKSSDEERKSSSGNTSEDFEKIDPSQLEEHINDIIAEAQIVLAEENDAEENISHKNDENIQKKILNELKQELKLEDEFLKALATPESNPESFLVTDIVKEFLVEQDNLISNKNEPILQKRESRIQFAGLDNKSEPNLAVNKNINDLNHETVFVPPPGSEADKEEMISLAEQIINDIEDELQNVNVEKVNENIEPENEKLVFELDAKPIEDTKPEDNLRKSEERFMPHQNSSEDRADRKKKRQDRLKRDLEALTSSVEEAMGTKLVTLSPTGSFEASEEGSDYVEEAKGSQVEPQSLNESFEANEESIDNKIVLDQSVNSSEDTELSNEDLEILQRYQSEFTEEKFDQKKDTDQGSENSFDSTDTVQESGAAKDNEYLFGSKEQKSLLAALDMSTSGQGNGAGLQGPNDASDEDDEDEGIQNKFYTEDPGEKEVEHVEYEYESEEEDLQDEDEDLQDEEEEFQDEEDLQDEYNIENDQEDLQYENDPNKESEESDLEDEERSLGRSSLRDDGRLNGDVSENRIDVANGSETNAENEISDEDEIENDEDEDDSEEIEEIIEYVDNTDEEGEEIIEIESDEIRNGHH